MARNTLIVWWLRIVAAFVVATLVVGGATRLTDSGLSITEWQPIMGVIPPLTHAAWERALELYRQIPEYQLVNRGMSMAEFQSIFWWEWAHRLIARSIGLVFAVPMVIFWIAGRLPGWFKPWAVVLLLLGGLQGAVGWWMVTSGLAERVDVSQYRLAVHMTLACVILSLAVWLSVRLSGRAGTVETTPAVRRGARLLPFLILFQIALGALVAGLDAGLASDTWPLMLGKLVPDGLLTHAPGWINLFENPLTVQFDHRIVAYLITLFVVWHAFAARGGAVAGRALALVALVLVQVAIGIGVVMHHVPLPLAASHQLAAAVILWASVVHATRVAPAGAVLAQGVPQPAR
ncbi:COX15/CtaA family protein [Acuticoccus mangrovi]|uniref:Heme A synthase n=1 Tax=Acuticoccus mangrovi TaxID=2796142 RepID=A0A934IE71_9HYPH|nr:COX15/CtaA family protein [Acuticoccus mangrovi]MBJ3774903.1 COX15/CtaA family protein [Acuticoccus mangrovi]